MNDFIDENTQTSTCVQFLKLDRNTARVFSYLNKLLTLDLLLNQRPSQERFQCKLQA